MVGQGEESVGVRMVGQGEGSVGLRIVGQGEKKAIETGNAYCDTCMFVFFRNALNYYLEMLSLRMNETILLQ